MIWNTTYKIVSTANFVLHALLFVFILVCAFLPFRGERNYFTAFNGFFGTALSVAEPYLLLLLPLSGAVISYFTIRRPWLSIWIFILFFIFFVIVAIPYAFEAVFTGGFASYEQEFNKPVYGIGFNWMMDAAYIIYWEVVFFIYSIVSAIFSNRKAKE